MEGLNSAADSGEYSWREVGADQAPAVPVKAPRRRRDGVAPRRTDRAEVVPGARAGPRTRPAPAAAGARLPRPEGPGRARPSGARSPRWWDERDASTPANGPASRSVRCVSRERSAVVSFGGCHRSCPGHFLEAGEGVLQRLHFREREQEGQRGLRPLVSGSRGPRASRRDSRRWWSRRAASPRSLRPRNHSKARRASADPEPVAGGVIRLDAGGHRDLRLDGLLVEQRAFLAAPVESVRADGPEGAGRRTSGS